MTTPGPVMWAELQGSLPGHDDEMQAAHEGRPTLAEQNARNGAGIPAVDRGLDDKEKLR